MRSLVAFESSARRRNLVEVKGDPRRHPSEWRHELLHTGYERKRADPLNSFQLRGFRPLASFRRSAKMLAGGPMGFVGCAGLGALAP